MPTLTKNDKVKHYCNRGTTMKDDARYKDVCKPAFDEIKSDVKEILTILKGNGKIGLTTQAELNRTAIIDLGNTQSRLITISLSCIGAIALIFAGIMVNDWLTAREHQASARAGIVTVSPNQPK